MLHTHAACFWCRAAIFGGFSRRRGAEVHARTKHNDKWPEGLPAAAPLISQCGARAPSPWFQFLGYCLLKLSRMSSDLRHHLAGVLSAGRSPLLLLQSSDGAELIARKNGLSVAALLAPFCALKNVSIPVRAGEC